MLDKCRRWMLGDSKDIKNRNCQVIEKMVSAEGIEPSTY